MCDPVLGQQRSHRRTGCGSRCRRRTEAPVPRPPIPPSRSEGRRPRTGSQPRRAPPGVGRSLAGVRFRQRVRAILVGAISVTRGIEPPPPALPAGRCARRRTWTNVSTSWAPGSPTGPSITNVATPIPSSVATPPRPHPVGARARRQGLGRGGGVRSTSAARSGSTAWSETSWLSVKYARNRRCSKAALLGTTHILRPYGGPVGVEGVDPALAVPAKSMPTSAPTRAAGRARRRVPPGCRTCGQVVGEVHAAGRDRQGQLECPVGHLDLAVEPVERGRELGDCRHSTTDTPRRTRSPRIDGHNLMRHKRIP